MIAQDEVQRSLKRLLVNGPLTGFPSRQADHDMMVTLAGSLFEPGPEYREPEINDVLSNWLATFCAPYGIDHVTIRRTLVDRRMLVRDKAGTVYRAAAVEAFDAARTLPGDVLREIEDARALRKQQRAAHA
jgi:hypothetical protein